MEIAPRLNTEPHSLVCDYGTPTGSIVGVQTLNDGVEYSIQEVVGVPGISVTFRFEYILRFSEIFIKAYYKGTATHYVQIQLYNKTTATWETFTVINNGAYYDSLISDVINFENYIQGDLSVLMRFYHPECFSYQVSI